MSCHRPSDSVRTTAPSREGRTCIPVDFVDSRYGSFAGDELAKDGFRWQPGQPPPNIESHSHAKLNLLALYLDRYFDTVVVNPAMDKISITLVDGFSGGGQYLRHGGERPGSPFVLLDAVARAELRHNQNRKKPLVLDAQFYFIDANRGAIAYLKHELEQRGYGRALQDGRIELLNATFEATWHTIVDQIRSRHRGGRSVFVLDQKGWNAVQFGTIRSILTKLPRSEVLLTFAVDWLTAYLNNGDAYSKAMYRLGIDGGRLQKYVEAKGSEGYQYVIPRLLLQDIRDLTGAPFFTPFFLRSERAQRDLWIVHLSKIVTARNVMIESHWRVGNSSLHRGEAGLDMLGFDPHWEDGVSFDFGFDAHANARIAEAMIDAIPYKIEEIERLSIPSVREFISTIANDTAATKAQIESALGVLHREGQIDVLNKSGNRKRAGAQISVADHVRLARQPLLPGFSLPD